MDEKQLECRRPAIGVERPAPIETLLQLVAGSASSVGRASRPMRTAKRPHQGTHQASAGAAFKIPE